MNAGPDASGALPGASGVSSPPSMSARGNMKPLPLRRRRSKGTIAGFAAGGGPSTNGELTKGANGDSGGDNVSTVSSGSSAAGAGGSQPQHVADGHLVPPAAPAKPCHSARLALLACQNAIRMGARTQLGLCPPGQARRSLQSALHQSRSQRRTSHHGGGLPRPTLLNRNPSQNSSIRSGVSDLETGGYYGLDKMMGDNCLEEYDSHEQEYLLRPNPDAFYEDESEFVEDASSGDEDDLRGMEELLAEQEGVGAGAGGMTSPTAVVDLNADAKGYAQLREPLYTPAGTDPGVANPTGNPIGGVGSGGSGKLPFNYRKIRWFDVVTASDRAAARQYLSEELKKAKKRDGMVLVRHLKRMQRRERRRIMLERGEVNVENAEDLYSDEENDDMFLEQSGLGTGVGQFGQPMTPSLSAAFVLESLSLNGLESVEGMAKCYDGIVAAGVALLDSEVDDPTTLVEANEEKKRPSRSEIMAALAPLLITTLEQPSGEVVLSLARLRRMCGTARYQRRFVQRVAPCLIRPPNGAMWCLRHQSDMEPILAATEMIFDAAFEVLSGGWYDRGRLLLADSARAETLHTAAMQLKQLSAVAPGDGLTLGLNTPGGGHGHRRGNSLMIGSAPVKDSASSSSNEPLAEWEVLAVDRQIRKSITNIFTRDWSRVVLIPPRDHDHSGGRSHRRGISSAAGGTAKTRTSSSASAAPSADIHPVLEAKGGSTSPSSASSPISPPRSASAKAPLSPPPPSTPPSQLTAESIESTFGPSFAAQPAAAVAATATAPPDAPLPGEGGLPTPKSPPPPRRGVVVDEVEQAGNAAGRAGVSVSNKTALSLTPPRTPQPQHTLGVRDSGVAGTPPLSPSSPPRGSVTGGAASPTLGVAAASAASPGTRKETTTPPLAQQPLSSSGGDNNFNMLQQAPQIPLMSPTHGNSSTRLSSADSRPGADIRAPLSPGNASVGSVASESSHGRISSSSATASPSAASAAASSAQSAHYRMLTSTAAERKRTVAACRALRAQISRFEEAFIQLHGRPPKGAAERAPLATTYAQYREWKRAIRADAACRIQALFRGARTRWVLLRSNNPRMSRVVMTRAGRPGYGTVLHGHGGFGSHSGSGSAAGDRETVLKQLSIPVEIGGNDSDPSPHGMVGGVGSLSSSNLHREGAGGLSARVPSPSSQQHMGVSDDASEVSNIGVEVFISPPGASGGGPSATTPSLSPNWSTTPTLSMGRRRSGSGDHGRPKSGRGGVMDNESPSGQGSGPQHYQSPSSGPVGGSNADLTELSLPELQARKRELKQQLKQYDMNFARQHGRMPVKAEKEPIRHLYESYNTLKGQITLLEREGHGGPGSSSSYRSKSSGGSSSSIGSGGADSSGDDSPTNITPPAVARPKRKEKSKSSSSTMASGAPSQDLAALKAEKGTLHQMLRSYEKDFFKEHKRQVSSFADIRPVASQYRRYKEIKKAIAALQQSGGER